MSTETDQRDNSRASSRANSRASPDSAAYGPAEFMAGTGVSRETLERLKIYADLLVHWQRAINLVSRHSLHHLWRRHMLDSAQLLDLMPKPSKPYIVAGKARKIVDFGSGAGFPGMVLAILNAGRVHLVDSDQRKCTFLEEVARETGTKVKIHCARIESLNRKSFGSGPAAVITARACSALVDLLGYAEPFLGPQTVCLFLKGQDVGLELTDATKSWKMDLESIPSRSDPTGSVLRVKGVSHV